ncbi:MAG: AI-2E family transporter [Acidiferrobacterales bacterium]
MGENAKQPAGVPFLIAAASFVIVIAGMRAAEPIIVPFLLSVFLAIISAPPLFWLERKGLPRTLAMLVVIAGIIGILFVLAGIVGSSVNEFSRRLPVYQTRLQGLTTTVLAWLANMGMTVPEQQLLKHLNPGAVFDLVARALNGLGGVLGNVFLIFLTVLFILFEASSFPVKLRAILGKTEASLGPFDEFIDNVKRYLAIKTWTSLATGLAVGLWLAVLGVDLPILWGLLAFLLNFIPNIGSIIAAVPAVLLALVQLGIGPAAWACVGYIVVNIVIGSIVEPRFMGRGLGLSTLVVFVSLVFWGWVLGPVGMFLSVPLTMTAKIALEGNENTRWLAILLGSEAAAAAALHTPAQEAEAPGPENKGPGPPADG